MDQLLSEKLIPVLPMKEIIVFPEMIAPVFAVRLQSIKAVEKALVRRKS